MLGSWNPHGIWGAASALAHPITPGGGGALAVPRASPGFASCGPLGRGDAARPPPLPRVCLAPAATSPDQSRARAGTVGRWLWALQGEAAQRPVDSGGPGGLWTVPCPNLTVVSAEQTCLSSVWEETTSPEVKGLRPGGACLYV